MLQGREAASHWRRRWRPHLQLHTCRKAIAFSKALMEAAWLPPILSASTN